MVKQKSELIIEINEQEKLNFSTIPINRIEEATKFYWLYHRRTGLSILITVINYPPNQCQLTVTYLKGLSQTRKKK